MRRFIESRGSSKIASGLALDQVRTVIDVPPKERTLTNQAIAFERNTRLKRNFGGAVYRKQTGLWESQESMERDLTAFTYAPEERLIPQKNLLDAGAPRQTTTMLEGDAAESMAIAAASSGDSELAASSSEDSPLERGRRIIEEDLSYNTVGVAAWSTLGLDPAMVNVARAKYGPNATRVQARLLPALLDEAHNDVLMNGVTGSGKTAALLLAAVQGVRNEQAGMNVVIAANATLARCMHDSVVSMCKGFGGELVDRDADDMSWVMCAPFLEETEMTYKKLRRGKNNPEGAVRLLIATADVFAELMFKHKLQFMKFGYLRRVYVDDAGTQIPLPTLDTPLPEVLARSREATAAEMVLGTVHQMPGPEIRSVLQLGIVSADIGTDLKDHIESLCIKPSASTVILSPTRLPTTLHCLFSFYLGRRTNLYAHVVKLMRSAYPTIPGHCALFIRKEDNLLEVKSKLRKLGMDAKLFDEIYEGNGSFRKDWKFVLLREDEAPGLDIPFLSHVVITFTPTSRHSYLHMAGRVGRLGNVGWVYTVEDRKHARAVKEVVEELDVDVNDHTIDVDLAKVPTKEVEGWTKRESLYPMDPQYVVETNYEKLEDPITPNVDREFWDYPIGKEFIRPDYTPTRELENAFKSGKKLQNDVRKDPRVIESLQKHGFYDDHLRPTEKLMEAIKKTPHGGSKESPYGRVMK